MDREAQYLIDRLADAWTALDRARVTVWRCKLAMLMRLTYPLHE